MLIWFYVNSTTTKTPEMGAILNMKMLKKCHPKAIVIYGVKSKTKPQILGTMQGVLAQQVCVVVDK